MSNRRSPSRPLNGVVILDKPKGITSNQALQHVKRLFQAGKAGHTGSLDPLATGVLPICFGEATKFSQFLLNADKGYHATFRFGESTSTADAEGNVLAVADASILTVDAIETALAAFRGPILQVPPMVSALKFQGKPLYELARAGIEIEREPRPVTIYRFDLVAFRAGQIAEIDVEVQCSKGTYIRSLAHDLGQALAVGGHVSRLHRVQAGLFTMESAVSLDALRERYDRDGMDALDTALLPLDVLLQELPRLEIGSQSSHFFQQGQAIMDLRVYRLGEQGDKVRVCHENGEFLGVGVITDDGRIAPRRLVVA